ncbi:Uncharacterised protein [Acinetobacter baumannii]|nr:Uncharacterised protein [Acinetobacter baumannii]
MALSLMFRRLPSVRTASSVEPGLSLPKSIRSPSSASGMALARLTAFWNAALRLAYQPALKSAKR